MSKETVFLVVTSAFVLAGDIAKPGEIVEVTDSEARDFLRRGMARVATAEDGIPSDEPEVELETEPEQDADAPSDETAADGDAEVKPEAAAKPAKAKK